MFNHLMGIVTLKELKTMTQSFPTSGYIMPIKFKKIFEEILEVPCTPHKKLRGKKFSNTYIGYAWINYE